MSIRTKAVFWLISITIVISAANFGSGFLFTRAKLLETMENELVLARDIADDLISTRVNLLKSDARTVAERLKAAPPEDLEAAMGGELEGYPDFLALTIFDRRGIIAAWGGPVTAESRFGDTKYLRNALEGESLISTTVVDEDSGELVMYVCVPMNDQVLCVTIPGMLFARLLGNYRLWDTGNIFMIDEEGTMIASYLSPLVQNRYNFIEISKTDPNEKTIGDFFERMTRTAGGSGNYLFRGVERLCTYKRVSGSAMGWTLGVAAPLEESPVSGVMEDLFSSNLILLGIGVIIALLGSRFIAKPYYQIEEQKRHLEELNETARAASEAKTTFLANMSHEMRTPLNAIIGLSELTLDFDGLSGDTQDNLAKIHNSGMTLLGTVNDILDISKIEAGKFELVPVEYDVPSLINDTVTQNLLRIGEKPITFTLTIDETLPDKLLGDELRIRQLLNNLLSNAFKYTKEGTVDLNITCEREGAGVWLTAAVKDSGIGIRREDMAKLFSDYHQVDTRANRKIEGTGLGLAITKRMAEMMDGTIGVESEYGSGSVFTVRVKQGFVNSEPIGRAVAEGLRNFSYTDQKQKSNSRFVRIRLPYARVLVVDDMPTNLDVARGMMKPYGMRIDCVSSGQAAIDLIRGGETYNALFMDHMMPGMDGIETARIIRREIDTDFARTVPIIALTANAVRGSEETFLSHGFQAFLSKPIDIVQLDCVIRQWIRNREQEKNMTLETVTGSAPEAAGSASRETPDTAAGFRNPAFSAALQTAAEPGFGIDLEKALERFGDEQSLLEIFCSFEKNTPALLEQLGAAVERMGAGTKEAAEALASYAITVHGIKGSSRGICAEHLGNLAEALERAAKAGDGDFVRKHHGAFVKAAEALGSDIRRLCAAADDGGAKQRIAKPGGEVLEQLRRACEDLDMDTIDSALGELERYDYETQGSLVRWIRDQVDRMELQEVAVKLAELPQV